MALANGTYIIVSALNIERAIDVCNASDAAGTNIWLYKRNHTSAQYAIVTGTAPKQVIRFPLTGKVMDVANKQAKNGANVIQNSGTNATSQAWNIVADGNTVYNSDTDERYPTYIIKSAINNNFVLDLIGNTSAVGTNVQLHQRVTSRNGQRWAFIPYETLPAGYYRFIEAHTHRCCISSKDKNDGGPVYAAGLDAADTKQAWYVANDGTTTTIKNMYSGYYLTALGTTSQSGVAQKRAPKSGPTSYQRWLLQVIGSIKYDGATCPVFNLNVQAGPSLRIDVTHGGHKITSDVRVVSAVGGSTGQDFIAVPITPLSSNIPAPSDLGVAYSVGNTKWTNIWGRGGGVINAYPCWIGGYTNYQIRFRWRARKATSGDDEFGSWCSWRSDVSNDRLSTANSGWGNPKSYNCTPTLKKDPSGVSRRYGKAFGFRLTTTGIDKVEYQYQVRAVAKSGKFLYCGASATRSGKFCYQPTLTISQILFTADGLALTYTSDQKRNNNDLVIYSVTCVHSSKTYTVYKGGSSGYPINDIAYNGTAILPASKITFIPSVGDSVSVVLRFNNVDGAYRYSKQTITKTVVNDANKTLSFTPTFEVTDGLMLHVKSNVSGADKSALWIDYGALGGGYSKFNDVDGEWHIPLTFKYAYTAYVMVKKNGKWNIRTYSGSAVASEAYLFNFENASSGEQDWLQVLVNADEHPVFKRSMSYDHSVHMTNGNALEVVHFGNARSEQLTIQGVLPRAISITHSTVAKTEALVMAHYAWLRMPNTSHGGWRVAIESCDFDYSEPGYVQVSIGVRRINNPADW